MVSSLHLIEDAVSPVARAKRSLAAQARIRRARLTIAVSDSVRDWYLTTFRIDPATVRTVRNGISPPAPLDAAERERVRAELGGSAQTVLAAMVGIMRPGKGHGDVIEAARRLPGDSPVRFVLVGDGPLRPRLEEAAATLPPGRVVFTGFRHDVARVLSGCDLVVHPSWFDALPTALIAALAAGLPAVASSVGGIPEIITRDTGVLVPRRDVDAFAQAVTALAADRPLRARLGDRARQRFTAEFDAAVWAKRLAAIYTDVLGQPGKQLRPPDEMADRKG